MNLVKIRTEKGMTQKIIADAVGVTPQAISNYEAGIREPSLSTAKRIATVLEVTVDQLLEDESDDKGRVSEET